MLDLQHVFRPMFDRVRNGVAMCWTHEQRLQYQQVKRALQHLSLYGRRSFLWHSTPTILHKIIYRKENPYFS